MVGLQSNLNCKIFIGATEHNVELGINVHYDQVHHNQVGEFYTQDSNGAITSRVDGVPGSDGNKGQGTHSLALSLEEAN